MKAVVYKGDAVPVVEERPVPKVLKPTDAVIKVTLTTICSSDIHILHGAVPRAVPNTVLGHEFVGQVVEIGEAVKKVKPGDRVAVNVETYCGECFYCKKGFVNNCTDPHGGWALGCRIDGGQAEYTRIPFADQGLIKIPENVSDEAALFTGDLLSTGYWSAKIGEIHKGDTVAVIGAGPTGLCTMMCAGLYEPEKIIAIDVDQSRLNLVKKNGLADQIINASEYSMDHLEALVKASANERGADTVIEAAGSDSTFEMAWRIARPNAVVVVTAMYESNQSLPLPQMYGKNLTFKTGGVDGCDCEKIMTLIAEGRLDTGCMITHRMELDQILEAYRIFEHKEDGVIKMAIRP